jgi:endonuclease YncB( thermonuclease family)
MRWWLAVCVVFAVAQAAQSAPSVLHGRVVAVSDGDTVTVALDDGSRVRVRLAAIDAPETSCHGTHHASCVETMQPYGKAARDELAQMTLGKDVALRVVDADRYGRSVGFLYLGNLDVNYEMVARGAACHFTRYARRVQSTEEFARYQQAELAARAQRRGQWQQPAQCGWEYRATHQAR